MLCLDLGFPGDRSLVNQGVGNNFARPDTVTSHHRVLRRIARPEPNALTSPWTSSSCGGGSNAQSYSFRKRPQPPNDPDHDAALHYGGSNAEAQKVCKARVEVGRDVAVLPGTRGNIFTWVGRRMFHGLVFYEMVGVLIDHWDVYITPYHWLVRFLSPDEPQTVEK